METKTKRETKAQVAERERQEFCAKLREFIKPGDTLYTTQRTKRTYGTRYVRLSVARIADDGRPYIQDITYWAARAIVSRQEDYGMPFGGCGYSATFQAVYDLGRSLWPNGNGAYVSRRNGDTCPETDGGYMLQQGHL